MFQRLLLPAFMKRAAIVQGNSGSKQPSQVPSLRKCSWKFIGSRTKEHRGFKCHDLFHCRKFNYPWKKSLSTSPNLLSTWGSKEYKTLRFSLVLFRALGTWHPAIFPSSVFQALPFGLNIISRFSNFWTVDSSETGAAATLHPCSEFFSGRVNDITQIRLENRACHFLDRYRHTAAMLGLSREEPTRESPPYEKTPTRMNHLFDSILLELILYLPLDPKNGRKLLWNGSQEIDASLPLRPWIML